MTSAPTPCAGCGRAAAQVRYAGAELCTECYLRTRRHEDDERREWRGTGEFTEPEPPAEQAPLTRG